MNKEGATNKKRMTNIEYFDSIKDSVMIQLCLKIETIRLARKIIERAEEQRICQKRKPKTIAAAAIYLAMLNRNERRLQAKIKKAVGVSVLQYVELAEGLNISCQDLWFHDLYCILKLNKK